MRHHPPKAAAAAARQDRRHLKYSLLYLNLLLLLLLLPRSCLGYRRSSVLPVTSRLAYTSSYQACSLLQQQQLLQRQQQCMQLSLSPSLQEGPHETQKPPFSRTSLCSDSASSSSVSSSSNRSSISSSSSSGVPPSLARLVDDLCARKDPRLRMQHLMALGAKAQPLDPRLRTPQNKVQGCISEVYVHCTSQRNNNNEVQLFYEGESNAVLTAGLLQLLLQGLRGSKPEEVLSVPLDLLKRAKLQQYIAISRMNGFASILRKMKEQAATAATNTLPSESS
ncbi:hypothetical protein Esti_001895 [Eimeria stiedai]